MPLTQAGRNELTLILIGDTSGGHYNNANSQLGVGNSTIAVSAAHTNLQGASKTWTSMAATYPTVVTNVLAYRGSFTAAQANHVWAEIGLRNSNSTVAGVLLVRHLAALGTKTTGIWQLTDTLTLST